MNVIEQTSDAALWIDLLVVAGIILYVRVARQ